MCILSSPLDWPWNTTPKRPLKLWNLVTGSEVMETTFSMSDDMYRDFANRLALKNYSKMSPDTLKSVHWIRSYGDVLIHVSWCVKWPCHCIGLEKLFQKELWHFEICPLDHDIYTSDYVSLCQRDGTWSSTINTEVMEMSCSMSAELYTLKSVHFIRYYRYDFYPCQLMSTVNSLWKTCLIW